MTAQSTKAADQSANQKGMVTKSGKPPYPFRTLTALVLLAGNFLVAAIYFHVINP